MPDARNEEDQLPVSGSRAGDELRPGTSLFGGQYTISRFLNSGGFGITYLADDKLERQIVIKECFPSAMCFRENGAVHVRSRSQEQDFATIVRLFVNEARRLAKLDHPNIVGVHQVFEDNDTAYMSLELVKGNDLLQFVREGANPLNPEQIKSMLLKLLDAVQYIHERDILHRDIAPDNILVDQRGEPILIDFGAAREQAVRSSRLLSSLHTVKDGYSPYEFYITGSPQSQSSDLYSLAATFYHVITGSPPPDSQARVAAAAEGRRDPFVPLTPHNYPFDRFFLSALNNALEVFPKDRIQTASDWILQIHTEKRRAAALVVAQKDKKIEDSIFRLVAETNEAVLADRDAVKSAPPKARQPIAQKKAVAQQKAQVPPVARSGQAAGVQVAVVKKGAGQKTAQAKQDPSGRPADAAVPAPAANSWRKIKLGLPVTRAVWRFALSRLFGLAESGTMKR